MRRLLLRWIVLAVSVIAASLVCRALDLGFEADFHSVRDIVQLMIGVALLSFLNATVGTVLKLMTLPLSCITLGLFSLVVNAIVLYLAAMFDFGFHITQGGPRGFVAAFVASLLIAFISGVLGVYVPDDKDD